MDESLSVITCAYSQRVRRKPRESTIQKYSALMFLVCYPTTFIQHELQRRSLGKALSIRHSQFITRSIAVRGPMPLARLPYRPPLPRLPPHPHHPLPMSASHGVHHKQPSRRRQPRPGDSCPPSNGISTRKHAPASGSLRVFRARRKRGSCCVAGEWRPVGNLNTWKIT